MDIQAARVLVTGGSAGIGLETARQLRRKGAQVAICGRDEGRLREAAAQIDVLPLQADVAQETEADGLIERVVAGLGGFDTLINNAGIGGFAPLLEIRTEDFLRTLQTNLVGAMLVGRAAARHFVAQRCGHIVNVGSTAARKGFAGGSAYVASKFGLQGMTECWRAELRRHDVRVMQINPSEVLTGFGGREPPRSDRKLRSEDIAHVIVSMLALDDRGFVPEASVWATNPD